VDIVYYPHAIYASGLFLITQLSDVEPGHNFQDLTEFAAGQVGPQFTGSHMASPDNRFTTSQIKSILDATSAGDYNVSRDLSGVSVDTEYKAGDKFGARIADANLAHFRMRAQENTMIAWESLSARQGGLAELRCRMVHLYNSATGNDPLVAASGVALTNVSAVNHLFTLGPVRINGTVMEGVQEATLDNRLAYEECAGEGDEFLTYVGIDQYAPQFRFLSRNLAYLDTYGERGTALSSWYWWLKKKVASGINVPDATVEHILFAATVGTIKARRVMAGGKPHSEVTIDLAMSAQNTAAFTVDTTSDIDFVSP
jgi:hypothetical protein